MDYLKVAGWLAKEFLNAILVAKVAMIQCLNVSFFLFLQQVLQ